MALCRRPLAGCVYKVEMGVYVCVCVCRALHRAYRNTRDKEVHLTQTNKRTP